MIPILDLTEQYRSLKAELDAAVIDVMERGQFIMGRNHKALEEELAAYLGVRHALGLNSGTDALHLALRALDVGPGDEVITTPFTFAATTEAIGIVGATPVFADIDEASYDIDPAAIERAVTKRTKAIIPVHLYGNPADIDAIVAIARPRGIAIVEDCAQSIGARVGERMTGAIGDIGAFSFFPSKNLGAYGDAGLITTNSDALAARIRALRAHGGPKKYYHEELGVNSRLDEIQAAVLRVKLPHLEQWIEKRRSIARRYTAALAGVHGVVTPAERPGCRHVYHQYTVRVEDRDAIRQRLSDAGVQSMVYYPVPLHLQRVLGWLGLGEGSYPRSERAARGVLSIPMYPELTEAQQDQVVAALRAAVAGEAVA
jgi:dTDP-4-amino-4,6-dideoxygalactose transaminase